MVPTAIGNVKRDTARKQQRVPPPTMGEPRIVTCTEAARQLGCSPRSIQRWRRLGLLTTVVVNGRARVTTRSIRALIAEGTH